MTNAPEIRTHRLLLKPITPARIHEMFASTDSAGISDFFGTDQQGYNRLKLMHEKGMETHRISLLYFLLYDKTQERVIGECGFHSWDKTHERAELFYNLKEESFKRKGLMSEALHAVLNFGFKQMQLHRIEALTARDNIASIRLLDKFGFTKEGTVREDYIVDGKHEDSECYSLLKHEWK
jgi:ribosomal-protein-alanine N-acetyltransferase